MSEAVAMTHQLEGQPCRIVAQSRRAGSGWKGRLSGVEVAFEDGSTRLVNRFDLKRIKP